jgi:hypothetical protein
MFEVLWANKQIELLYTTMTLILTSLESGVSYRYEKAWREYPGDSMLISIAQTQIEELKTELALSVMIEDAIIYEDGLEA